MKSLYKFSFYSLLMILPISAQNKVNNISPIKINYVSGELTVFYENILKEFENGVESILKRPVDERTVENTLVQFDNLFWLYYEAYYQISLFSMIYPEEKVRNESYTLLERSSKYWNGFISRKDIYLALKSIKPTGMEKRLLDEFMIIFEESGLHLAESINKKVKDLRDKLSQLSIQFSKNIDTDSTYIVFTKEELDGISASFINSLKKSDNGDYVIPIKTPYVMEILENANNSEIRKKTQFAFENRSAETNTKLLEEIIVIRREIAQLLGYKNWAEYKITKMSARSVEKVKDVVSSLKNTLSSRKNKDLDQLLELKKKLFPGSNKLDPWDINYLTNQIRKQNYFLDNEKVREYFPMENVITNMFEIFSELLNLEIGEVKNAEVWFSDVKLYDIKDRQKKNTLAYLYFDLYPRPGKYSWYVTTVIRAARILPDGNYNIPVTLIAGNWNPPSDGKPALLTFDEVQTLFHEFGHALQASLYREKYATLNFSYGELDVVEVPSVLLENWTWQPEVLNIISGHYKDTSQKIPKEYIDKIIASRNICSAYNYISGIKPYRFEPGVFLTSLDLEYHTPINKIDVTQIYNKLYKEIIGLEPLEGAHYPASWTHMVIYDGFYYAYLWGELFSSEVFFRFENEGLFNKQTGKDYRVKLLEKWGTNDMPILIKEFLGREANSNSFMRRLGIFN